MGFCDGASEEAPGPERTLEELEGTPEQSIRLRVAGGGVTGPTTRWRVEGSRGLGERRFLLRNRSGTLFEGWG